MGNQLARSIGQVVAHLHLLGLCMVVAQGDVETEDAVAVAVVEGRDYAEIADGCLGLAVEEDVAFNAAQAPEVLALQVRACAPAEDFQYQRVFALFHVGVDEVFSRVFRILVVANLLSVEIDIDARFGTGDVEEDVAFHPPCGDVDFAAIDAHGDVVGQLWRFGVECLELVTDVGVEGGAMALSLPVAGHLDVAPARCVAHALGDVGRQAAVRVGVEELPGAVERAVIGALFVASRQGIGSIVVGHKGRAGCFAAHGHCLNVLPVGQFVASRLCVVVGQGCQRTQQQGKCHTCLLDVQIHDVIMIGFMHNRYQYKAIKQ